jgi:hypothetical protein
MLSALVLVGHKLYHYRRIEYLLKKREFAGMNVPLELIEKGDSDALEEHLKAQLGLESFTIAELRDRAAILRISPIFGVSKATLILRIREHEQAKATNRSE